MDSDPVRHHGLGCGTRTGRVVLGASRSTAAIPPAPGAAAAAGTRTPSSQAAGSGAQGRRSTPSDGGCGGPRARAGRRAARPRRASARPGAARRRMARADEVGMIGVREPVRVRFRRRHDRALFEHEDDASCPAATRRSAIASVPFAYAIAWLARWRMRSSAPSRAATPARNWAPSISAVRISTCGSRGPLSEPAPSSAPRRYADGSTAVRRHARADGRSAGGRSRARPRDGVCRRRAGFPRRAAGTALSGRTPVADTYGSRTRRRMRAAA